MIALVQEIRITADTGTVRSLLELVRDDVTPQLKKLDLSSVAFTYIDPALVSSAVLKLEQCIIRVAQPGQRQAILAGINNSANTNLRYLDLGGVSGVWLWAVAPDIVAGAAMKLETFKARLSSLQAQAILTMLAATEDFRLRDLVVWGPAIISTLDPEVVAGALTKLETVGWDISARLSPGQVAALFGRIRESPGLKLRHLILGGQNISLLPRVILVGAIQRLEVVEFRWGEMTAEQVSAILTLVKENRLGRIKKIKIIGVNYEGPVSPALLHEAKLNSALVWR